MKKILAVILLAMLVFTGCGQKNDTQDSTDTDNSGNTQTEQTGEATKYSVPRTSRKITGTMWSQPELQNPKSPRLIFPNI